MSHVHGAWEQVLGSKTNQSRTYEEVEPLVMSALDGFNACIIAYGQTGAGKTYTMQGTDQDRGVLFRSLHTLFSKATAARETMKYRFQVREDTRRDPARGRGLGAARREGPTLGALASLSSSCRTLTCSNSRPVLCFSPRLVRRPR